MLQPLRHCVVIAFPWPSHTSQRVICTIFLHFVQLPSWLITDVILS